MNTNTQTLVTEQASSQGPARTSDSISACKAIGMWAGIIGSCWLAIRIASSGYAFVTMLVSNLTWGYAAWRTGDRRLLLMNVVWAGINLVGIWRYLLH